MLIDAPDVVQRVSMRMTDLQLMLDIPNVDSRYEHLIREMGEDSNVFERYAPVKLAVFKIALVALESLATDRP